MPARPVGEQGDRDSNILLDHFAFQRAACHIHQNTLAQSDFSEIGFIGVVGAFRIGTGRLARFLRSLISRMTDISHPLNAVMQYHNHSVFPPVRTGAFLSRFARQAK